MSDPSYRSGDEIVPDMEAQPSYQRHVVPQNSELEECNVIAGQSTRVTAEGDRITRHPIHIVTIKGRLKGHTVKEAVQRRGKKVQS